MKVLVLGATGKLGCASALGLKNAGYDVIAAGRRSSDNGFFSDFDVQYLGDIVLECSHSFLRLPNDIDAVVNMAGSMPAHADATPMPYVQSIIVGMVNLLEWMRQETTARRIVFNTTPSDMCDHFGAFPVPDNASRSFPKDGGDHAVYAICKNAAVDILEHYKIAFGFKPIVFRHMTVYGWHPSAKYYVNGVEKILPWRQIVRRALRGDPIEVWGDPRKKKELLYIDDFADAIVKAVSSSVCGLFNLPGFRPYTLEEQIDGIISAFSPEKCPSPKLFCPGKPSTPENLLAGERARCELGWVAKVPWVDACRRMRKISHESHFSKLWGPPDREDAL